MLLIGSIDFFILADSKIGLCIQMYDGCSVILSDSEDLCTEQSDPSLSLRMTNTPKVHHLLNTQPTTILLYKRLSLRY